MGSSPSAPKPQEAPKPQAPPPTTVDPVVTKKKESERKRLVSSAGRESTVLSTQAKQKDKKTILGVK